MRTVSVRIFTVSALTALGVLFAGHLLAGSADDHHRQMMRSHEQASGDISRSIVGMLGKAVHQLDLSDEQKEDIHAIFSAGKEDLKANHMAARENRQVLHEILTAPVFDEEALAEAARIEGDLVAERIMMSGSMAAQVLGELDDNQRAELELMAEHHREKMRAHRGHKAGTDPES